MIKLISIDGYIKKEFDPSGAPSPQTVRRWCADQKIDAVKRGGTWFIKINDTIDATGNPLIDRVLAG